MSSRLRRFKADVRGAAAIEFAIAGPLFLAFVFAILIGGWVLHGAASVRHALETAGRQLLITPLLTEDELNALVQQKVAYLGDLGVRVTLAYDQPIDGIVIAHAEASYDFTVTVPLLRDFSFRYSSSIAVPLPS